MKATIYHNPNCGTSRKTLDILRDAGADVRIHEYLKSPPARDDGSAFRIDGHGVDELPSLSKLLRAERADRRITQAEAAQLIGVAQPTYAGWEVGRSSPDPASVARIAHFLGMAEPDVRELTDEPFVVDSSSWPALGRLIGERREALRLTRTALAQRLKVSASTIVNWELGYRTPIDYAQRLTWGGEYIHAAPWSVAQQGHRNVSHGCINMSDANAKWLFNLSSVGDPVVTKGTERQLKDGNGWTHWNMTWDEYVKGSALPFTPAGSATPTPTPTESGSPDPTASPSA